MTQRRNDEPEEKAGDSTSSFSGEIDNPNFLADEAAAKLEKLYEEFAPNAYKYLRSRGVESHLSADLVQQSFENIGRHMRSGRTINSPLAFIIKTVHNTWAEHLRRPENRNIPTENVGQHEYDMQAADDIDQAITRIDQRDMANALEKALAQLPPREGEVVKMHHFAALSIAKIAEILNIAEGTVRYNLSIGRRRLRTLLDQCSNGEEKNSE